MEDKYKMASEENIFVAKRNIVDLIWKSVIKFYETDDIEEIKELVYNHCIDGINFRKE